MDKDLEILNQKLDHITERLEETARRQKEFKELQHDLTPIVSDLYQSVVMELDQLSPYFTYEDMLYLVKKLVRNTRNITAMVEQMENISDFVKDAMPLSKPLFQTTLENLNTLEQKGYFTLGQQLLQITDKLVTSFDPKEIDNMAQNMDVYIDLLKKVSPDKMTDKVQEAVKAYDSAKEAKPASWFKILKELNDPNVRREIFAFISSFKVLTKESHN